MAKQKKTKQAGYVPFTRDDIQLQDGRNTRAEELFLQMLDIPKRVVKKKKKGRETEIVDDDFYPTSMDELQRMEGKMVQVEAAIDDRSDREFMDNVAYMKDVLAWSGKRQWNFAWWIVLCVAVMAIYYFVQAGNRAEDRDAVKNWSEEVVKAKYDDYVNVGMNNVTYWEGQVAAAPDEATKKSASETLENAREEYANRLEQSAESYHEDTLDGYNRRVRSSYISALWCLLWIALYIVAERPYGYMLSKRRTEMKVYRGLRGALFGIAGAFVGAAAALQVTEYVTTYSDGSKERSNDAMPILLMKLGLIAVAVLLVLFVARIVIVIATIMGFIRNYDLIALSKKTFKK
jgi:hypothetical protein